MKDSMIITRIAPSPSKAQGKTKSGLHLGNVRTALFCYLAATQKDGKYLFRIENTDTARCSETGADDLLSELNWLGLTPNRGYGSDDKPAGSYTQMGRLPIYQKYVEQLLAEGKAYKCYCTSDELDKARQEATAKNPKDPFRYPGTCRELKALPNKGYVIRLRAPKDGVVEFNDLVFGKMVIPNKENYDFVICRENGIPLFNFANAIDDFFVDNTTHIIRGRDHLGNTPIQILIGQALGMTEFPLYAHLPMMLGPSGAKLSKRDGAVSVLEFKEAGYAPKAILNYLARFGWSFGNQEVFSMKEMVDNFDINRINKADGKFDYKKFASINYEHLKSEDLLPDSEYAAHLKPFIDKKDIGDFTTDELIPYIKVIRSRAKTFIEAADLMTPMLLDKVSPPDELIAKTFTPSIIKSVQSFHELCDGAIAPWNEGHIRQIVQEWLSYEGLSLKDIGAPLRVSLLGQTQSPELFAVLGAMGKERVLDRLAATMRACDNLSH